MQINNWINLLQQQKNHKNFNIQAKTLFELIGHIRTSINVHQGTVLRSYIRNNNDESIHVQSPSRPPQSTLRNSSDPQLEI